MPRTPPEPIGSDLKTVALEVAANAVFITDSAGRIIWVNPAFERLSGFSCDEALGKTPRILKSGKQDDAFYQDLWSTICSGEPWSGRVVNRRKDGNLFTVAQTVTPIVDDGGKVTHFVAIHEDLTPRLEAEERVAYMARHDFLTGLPNRYALEERLEQEIDRGRRFSTSVVLMMLDLDDFKGINDGFGHTVGDAVLVETARRLRAIVRRIDTLGRLGGDEFAMIHTDLVGAPDAGHLASRVLESLRVPLKLEGQEIFLSASVGIAVSEGGDTDSRVLMKQADLALYRAKKDGRNTSRFFSDEMNREVERRMALSRELHRALEAGQLFLEYQPQVDIPSRRIVGAEALLRWNHPEWGLVPPATFIPIAETNGMIVSMGDWILRTACTDAKSWQRLASSGVPVAVNVSAVQFRNPNFVSSVAALLEELDLAPELLEIELTESVLLHSGPEAEAAVRELRNLGVRISLDDFGRGYSSLEYLRRLPLNKLKIDRSFVSGVAQNNRDATILRAVIALATELGLDVIAEGVEPADFLRVLQEEGCDEAQGFYFSHPMSFEAFTELLTEGSERIKPSPPRQT